MTKINCLIVDDEPLARKGMEEYVNDMDGLLLKGTCSSATEAAAIMQNEQIDLLFLDIEMPGITGIQFLRSIQHPLAVILTTAFSEYAVEGFNLDVTDYLLKPIAFSRFKKAVQKATDYLQTVYPATKNDFFFLKVNGQFEKIFYHDILFVQAKQNYVSVQLNDKKLLSYMTISTIEKTLPASTFMRVHKSFLVSLSKINALAVNSIFIDAFKIPVSRNMKERLQKQVLLANLLK